VNSNFKHDEILYMLALQLQLPTWYSQGSIW